MDEQSHISDESLAQALRESPATLGTLIDRYEARLSRYISRKSAMSVQDTQDVLQNVFIKVYRNINDFDTTLSFSSWIYRITYNEMIDWYRKEKRRPHLSLEANEALMLQMVASDDVEVQAIAAEGVTDIQEALEKLPELYQEVAILRFVEEKSYDEIADILMIPPGTVAIRLSRVKKLLRESLKAYE